MQLEKVTITSNTQRDKEFPHLSPAAIAILGWSNEERFKRIRRHIWFPYQPAEQILGEMERMLEPTDSLRVPGMLITADPNNGKTTLLHEFAKRHPAVERSDGTGIDVPVVLIDSPPKPDVGWFLGEILSALNAPYRQREKDENKLKQVIALFKRLHVRILIADEISDVVDGPAQSQRFFLNTIKQTATRARVSVVLSGTPRIKSAIAIDDQTKSRFIEKELPLWQPDRYYAQLLSTFERTTPLRRASNLVGNDSSLAEEIMVKSRGRIGGIFELLQKGAVRAIETGEERITKEIIDAIIL